MSGNSFSSDDNPCKTKNGGAYSEASCMEYQVAVENTKLKKVYKAALLRTEEENKYLFGDLINQLKLSQQYWLNYRNSHCEFEGSSRGAAASWSGWHIDNCKLLMTQERIEYLKAVFWG